MKYTQLEPIVKDVFKEVMPSDYAFNIVPVYGYMEVVPDSDSRIFNEEELSSLIDTFNNKLKEKTDGAHAVGGYKVSNSHGRIKLLFITIL